MYKLEKGMFTTVPILCVEGQSPYTQTLYTWMCKYSNDDGQCRPSMKTLSSKTGMSKNMIIKSIKKLEELGLILKTNRFKEGEYTSNMYDVYINNVQQRGSACGGQPSACGGQPSAPQGQELKQLTKSNNNNIYITSDEVKENLDITPKHNSLPVTVQETGATAKPAFSIDDVPDIVKSFIDKQATNIVGVKINLQKDKLNYYCKSTEDYYKLKKEIEKVGLEDRINDICKFIINDEFRQKNIGSFAKLISNNKEGTRYWAVIYDKLPKRVITKRVSTF